MRAGSAKKVASFELPPRGFTYAKRLTLFWLADELRAGKMSPEVVDLAAIEAALTEIEEKTIETVARYNFTTREDGIWDPCPQLIEDASDPDHAKALTYLTSAITGFGFGLVHSDLKKKGTEKIVRQGSQEYDNGKPMEPVIVLFEDGKMSSVVFQTVVADMLFNPKSPWLANIKRVYDKSLS